MGKGELWLAEWQTQEIFPAQDGTGALALGLRWRFPCCWYANPLAGPACCVVLCCVPFRFAHEAPKTKEHLLRLGMDGAAFTRLCLITRANLDDETAQLRRLASRDSQSRARAVSSQRRSWWSRVYEARSMDWWSHSPGRPSTLPSTHPRVIINNSAYDSYPTARIARMMACMASAADPDLSTWSVPAQDKHQPGRATVLYRQTDPPSTSLSKISTRVVSRWQATREARPIPRTRSFT
jgi:hypothetical protein